MTAPRTRYARNGDVSIAYEVAGDGPHDVLLVNSWVSQMEHLWTEPRLARMFAPDQLRAIPRILATPDYLWAHDPVRRESFIARTVQGWGEGMTVDAAAPAHSGDPYLRDWFGRMERLAVGPAAVEPTMRVIGQTDVRDILPLIRVPKEVKTLGDGFLATFDGPARAVRCALRVAERSGEAGVPVRAGIHTGECERVGGDVAGIAVHIAARVMGEAGAGEVFVSRTVCDLVAGSGLRFDPRGPRALRGVPGEWELFEAADQAA